jgi:hypothetical protein
MCQWKYIFGLGWWGRWDQTQKGLSLMVGLPGFEPGSIEPKSTSLDQTSRQPR